MGDFNPQRKHRVSITEIVEKNNSLSLGEIYDNQNILYGLNAEPKRFLILY
jgi:hypothetical protein